MLGAIKIAPYDYYTSPYKFEKIGKPALHMNVKARCMQRL
jgi:hypothetical protein